MSELRTKQARSVSANGGESRGFRRGTAFTLIELLVVISIIGVLASLLVGLSGVAGRKSKEARVRMEMNKLIAAIENYKSVMGFYPPDHRVVAFGREIGLPSPNQLFYELSGTVYRNNQFYVVGRQEALNPALIESWFGSSGFANAAREERDVKFTEEFKASQIKRISGNPPIDVLAVPVKGTAPYSTNYNGVPVNPWLYISTSPTNNPGRYDLWADIVVGSKVIRFSNWDKEPVVLSR